MSVVRILGFSTLSCGCVVGRYRDIASTREVVYVEEKGVGEDMHDDRANDAGARARVRFAAVPLPVVAVRVCHGALFGTAPAEAFHRAARRRAAAAGLQGRRRAD